ncbi:hypothetical protein NK718_19520 [Alsobacter sp. SYSU M60028]|uniref:Transposase n=1 Tax=Alsobacter ponti TaxID=2962936 RepID=A0ABT1LHZ8_9HYPH|nr:hypothetical protein [Alsobacter ponti]MCP8940721.1 hypothetical protein [Alsobacter ponti]
MSFHPRPSAGSYEMFVAGALRGVLKGLPAEKVGPLVEACCIMLQKGIERCASLARRDRQELEARIAKLEAENAELRTQLFMTGFARSERAA